MKGGTTQSTEIADTGAYLSIVCDRSSNSLLITDADGVKEE